MKYILFISDLHLSAERPDIIQLFLRFLDEKQATTDSLYILGDFVEYWLGDDDEAKGLEPVISRLKTFSDNGPSIYLMHGNRDFLMGEHFASRCGCQLINDPVKIKLHQQDILLMHGDTLCTDDTEYQMFRSMVRNSEWQKDFLSRPLQERRQMAQAMREKSRHETQQKAEEIMDVNQHAVEQSFIDYDIKMIIHGHTHRPGIHQLEINGSPATRIVLGDWYKKGSYLEFTGKGSYSLKDFY